MPGYDPLVVDGRLLCRTTVNLSGAPHGSEVWVDPSQQLVKVYLRRGLLVPVTDHAGVTSPEPAPPEPQETVGDDPSPETGEPSTEPAVELLEAENASDEAESPQEDPASDTGT